MYAYAHTMLRYALIIMIFTISITTLRKANAETINHEACETLSSDIHITKEEFDELGRLVRTCSGDITVNKCEGACNSQVQPSVIAPSGFLKECFCCRESFLRERAVMLGHCYDPDGLRLTAENLAQMEVKLREPSNCKCYRCGNNPST